MRRIVHKRHIKRGVIIAIAAVLAVLIFSYVVIQFNKNSIRDSVVQLLSDRFHSVVRIGSMDVSLLNNFPHLSIEFRNVEIADSLSGNQQGLPPAFACEDFSCSVALFPLFTGKVQIKTIILSGAKINFITTRSGISNFRNFQKGNSSASPKSSSSSTTFKNGKVLLEDVHFLVSDSERNKCFDLMLHRISADISSIDSTSQFRCAGTLTCNGLGFNLNQGSYLSHQDILLNSDLAWNPSLKKLSVVSASMQIAPFELNVTGSFNFADTGTFYLHISDPRITMSKIRELVTQHLSEKLSLYQFSDLLHAEVVVGGSLGPGKQPQIDVVFASASDGTVTLKNHFFQDARVRGIYTNHVDPSQENGDHNSSLIIPFFTGQLEGEVPITAKLRVNDLLDPYAILDASSEVALDSLNDLVDTSHFQFIDGTVKTRFQLFCPINTFVDTTNNLLHGEMRGSMILKNGNIWMPENDYRFEELAGNVSFDLSDMRADSLHVVWNDNPIVANLTISDIIPAIFIAKTKTYATANVFSNSFDVKKVIAAPETHAEKISKKIHREETRQKRQTDSISASAAYWDQVIYNMIVDMNLQAHRVQYKNFRAANLNAHVQFQPEGIQLQEADLQTAGGALQMQAFIADPTKKTHRISLGCHVNNVQVDELLRYCDNFNQTVITSKNIRGTLSADLKWDAGLKQDYEVISSSMKGKLIWSIGNGQLINFESLQAASKYFPNRDFTNISFARMQDTVTMQGLDFIFSRMQVQSSVFSFYAGGVYSFEGNTNLKVQFPLSNLKAAQPTQVDSTKHHAETTINFHLVNKDGKNVLLFDGFSVHKKK